MRNKKIIVCITALLLILSLVTIVATSKKKERVNPRPQNETTENVYVYSEPDNIEEKNAVIEPDDIHNSEVPNESKQIENNNPEPIQESSDSKIDSIAEPEIKESEDSQSAAKTN